MGRLMPRLVMEAGRLRHRPARLQISTIAAGRRAASRSACGPSHRASTPGPSSSDADGSDAGGGSSDAANGADAGLPQPNHRHATMSRAHDRLLNSAELQLRVRALQKPACQVQPHQRKEFYSFHSSPNCKCLSGEVRANAQTLTQQNSRHGHQHPPCCMNAG